MKGLSIKTLEKDRANLERQYAQVIDNINRLQVDASRIEGILAYINDNLQAFQKLEEKKARGEG